MPRAAVASLPHAVQPTQRELFTNSVSPVLLRPHRNIVSGGPSIIRKPGAYRSNLELTNSLRSNFLAAKQDYAIVANSTRSSSPTNAAQQHQQSSSSNNNGSSNGFTSNGHSSSDSPTPTPTTKTPTPLDQWTLQDGDTLYIPRVDWEANEGRLQEDPNQYEITVKVFFLPTSTLSERKAYAREALSLVMRELGGGVSSVSLLIVSFPGMSFEGDCEWEADKNNGAQGDDPSELTTWAEAIEPLYHEGLVKKLGIAEFGSDKLKRFLAGVTVKPSVDQINIKNCCNVPPPLVQLSKEKGIELYVHSDCTDVLPKGTLRELLGQGIRGAGVLADPAEGIEEGLRGDLTPQWVVKYTAVVRDRGVIENKGYFAGAVLTEE